MQLAAAAFWHTHQNLWRRHENFIHHSKTRQSTTEANSLTQTTRALNTLKRVGLLNNKYDHCKLSIHLLQTAVLYKCRCSKCITWPCTTNELRACPGRGIRDLLIDGPSMFMSEFMGHLILKDLLFASVYLLWRGIQKPGSLEAAVKVATSDYLARYGDILSGNYTIWRLVAGFTALTARTISKVWLHNKNVPFWKRFVR